MVLQLDLCMSPSEDAQYRLRFEDELTGSTPKYLGLSKRKSKPKQYPPAPLARPMQPSHLSRFELMALFYLYNKLTNSGQRPLDRFTFKEAIHSFMGFGGEEILDRIYSVMDKGGDGLNFEQWIELFSLIIKGHQMERIAFCFNVYDPLNLGYLNKDTMTNLLKPMIGTGAAEDYVTDLLDILLKKMDTDRDGKVTYQEYKEGIRKWPELMEFLGRCFPEPYSLSGFMVPISPHPYPMEGRYATSTNIIHGLAKERPSSAD